MSEYGDAIGSHQSFLETLGEQQRTRSDKDFCNVSRLAYALGRRGKDIYGRPFTRIFSKRLLSRNSSRGNPRPKKAGCSLELVSDLRIVSFTKASPSPFVLFPTSLPLASIDEYRKKLAV